MGLTTCTGLISRHSTCSGGSRRGAGRAHRSSSLSLRTHIDGNISLFPPNPAGPGWQQLMQRCWAEEPGDRPEFR